MWAPRLRTPPFPHGADTRLSPNLRPAVILKTAPPCSAPTNPTQGPGGPHLKSPPSGPAPNVGKSRPQSDSSVLHVQFHFLLHITLQCHILLSPTRSRSTEVSQRRHKGPASLTSGSLGTASPVCELPKAARTTFSAFWGASGSYREGRSENPFSPLASDATLLSLLPLIANFGWQGSRPHGGRQLSPLGAPPPSKTWLCRLPVTPFQSRYLAGPLFCQICCYFPRNLPTIHLEKSKIISLSNELLSCRNRTYIHFSH